MEGATVTADNEADWLAERRRSLGASDAAAALGYSPYRTPIDVWQEKLGIGPRRGETDAMRWGKLLEPLVLAEYERRTGRRVGDRQLFARHPDHPRLTATLDGRADDGRLVEVKTAGAWAREWGDEETDAVPDVYTIQVHHQMAVTGAELADVAVLIGGQDFRVYTVPRNQALVDSVVLGGLEFWRCVETRTPPAYGRVTAQGLAAINPRCEGEAVLGEEAVRALASYLELGATAAGLEKLREGYKLDVLAALGGRQFARLPDGRTVKRFLQEVGERTQTVRAHTRHFFRVIGASE